MWDATRDGRASHVRDTRVCVERRDGKVRGERSAARPIVRANHYQSLGVTGPTGTTQDPRPSLTLSAQLYIIHMSRRACIPSLVVHPRLPLPPWRQAR